MQNFGKIKNAFNGILAEGILKKNNENKQLFIKYVQTIKESEILKTQFLIYNNIENKIESDAISANIFVSENIKFLEKYKPSQILKENKKLIALSEGIESKLDEAYDSKLSDLHESITNLIFTKKTPKTINQITENISSVVNYLKENKIVEKAEAINLPNSMLSTVMVDKYNEKYSTLDESEKKVLKALINSSDEEKKAVYSEVIKECLILINEKLDVSDLDAKDKLLRVKEKLLNDMLEVNEDFNKNISKLIELRSNLK
jgi:hypothetical protein